MSKAVGDSVSRPVGGSQRQHARADVHLDATYETVDAPVRHPAAIKNLGGGGMRLATAADLPREGILTVRFTLPKAEQEIVARAKVVLSFFDASEGKYLHGIAFTQIMPADQLMIITHVESLANAQPSDH